jgi:hypothetical protein
MEEAIQEWMPMLRSFSSQQMEDVGIPAFMFLMVLSLLSSLVISVLYTYFYQSRNTGSQIHRAFPLLGISITGIFICIQFSLPLSLGLLGALSIVRFRTPIKEPEEIGFLMLVIATSIACATFNLIFLGILLAIAVIALVIVHLVARFFKSSLKHGVLLLTLPDDEYQVKSAELFVFLHKKFHKGRLESISKHSNQTVISYSFASPRRQTFFEFQSELEKMVDISEFNIFFNRSGAI